MYLGFGLFLIMNIFRFILAPYIFLSFLPWLPGAKNVIFPQNMINQYFLLHWLRFEQTLLAAACCFMSLLVCSRLLKSKVALPTSWLWPTSDNEIQAHSLFSHCIRAEKWLSWYKLIWTWLSTKRVKFFRYFWRSLAVCNFTTLATTSNRLIYIGEIGQSKSGIFWAGFSPPPSFWLF